MIINDKFYFIKILFYYIFHITIQLDYATFPIMWQKVFDVKMYVMI